MKKIYLTLLSFFIAIVSMAQTPGFSYQAVILNPDVQSLPGNDVEQGLLSESDISIRFTIENELGTEYQETHTTKTDAYGMVSLMVGQGMATIGNFTEVAWVGAEKHLKVEIDFTASGASYESLDRQALTYLPQPLSLESNNRINDLELAINAVAADLTTIELTPGPQGNDGADGAQGPIGLTGADGTNGTNGIDGIDGVQGPIGLTGAAGTDGADGTNGTNGIDGIDGAQGPAGLDGNSSLWQTNNQTDFIASIMTVGGGSGRFHLDYDLINWGSAGQSTHRLIIHKMTNQPTTNDYSGWLTFIDPYDIITIRVQDFPERVMHFTVLPSGPNLTSPTTTGPYTGTFQIGDLFYLRLRVINYAPLSANMNPMNPTAFDINTPCYIGYVKTGTGIDGQDGVDGAVGATGAQGIQGVAGPQGPAGNDGVGIAQNLELSGDTLFITGGNYIILPPPTLLGCTDSTAINYNTLANTDNGTCIAKVLGCTDPSQINYDSLANTDDGSCIPFVYGCMDATQFNFNINANIDVAGGSCIPIVLGCTDSLAFNYDSLANTDDSLCVPITYGCMDTLACNYDIAVNVDDASCLLPDGCTDTAALNYDSTATCDDGSCASAIGDSYQGGIIFYLDGNGGGLICATEDQTYPTGTFWGCWGTNVTGTSMSLGTGAANTAALISQGCASTGKPARLCSDYTGGGYTDWYLPSYNELVKMYQQRNLITANPEASPFEQGPGGTGNSYHYWSSSASSGCGNTYCDIYAHAMRWTTNYYQYGTESNRNTNYGVRAIRTF